MNATRSIIDQSLRRLRAAWAELNTTLGRGDARLALDPGLPERDLGLLAGRIRDCLEMPGAEYARRAEATRIGHAYAALAPEGRLRALRLLGTDFDIDETAIEAAVQTWRAASDAATRARRREALRRALVAPRMQLLALFNVLPEGIRFLVDMRAELLAHDLAADPALAGVERDLRELLAGWFDIGFLQLQRIDWNTPAAFLEKLIAYEAVHAFSGWEDLKHRLAADRRLYAFVHPNMAGEPLIFVQVALCEELATNVQSLLDTTAAPLPALRARTAVFYSISNAQRGLAGISFGNYLIRRVVNDLQRELPQLAQFATLSPIPGFAAWLQACASAGQAPETNGAEREAISACARAAAVEPTLEGLLGVPVWHRAPELCAALRPVLLRAVARYLLGHEEGRARARDPVAHFHLGNGASVQQIDWLADTSPRGLAQSHGLMVNYLYDPKRIDRQSETYALKGEIAHAAAVERLAR